ncbi:MULTISPECIES: TonB-dependent receptor [Pseudomonas]|jgi:TonB-dependent receptor|uniref:Putative TonB-dependent outer membrane receptor protein n=1 Tax=Pseudomonas brassicacearum (strain NFM421) TaxID=994484 RepID=F2KGC8_PSEBN|nr:MULTISPECIES: TonB-dependent receptor [Pseudomonas]EIK65408.1 TonB-dependent outermembrane receptor [Pseudomonas fluorescens Q8r1-96]KIR18075.1 Vitamin B12 transporter BtuB [Pseudomonas fluorescens]AEA69264.1 putative TonB-dependent outer membrane receptor protein [Pseudomonas brassicacearum subsp. brassicacearum NFM421]ALQ03815.1 TonB-dependent receptor, in a cluster with 3-phytase [Pseudomonas brassicacearum]AOS37450.1 TonB-dependent receptor [Pseudomonas brassicacearum]
MYHRTSTAGLVGFTFTALAMAIASERLSAAEQAATEHVEVVGQAASIDQALKEQRSADSIKSVVHADGVAQLPDENVAEAVQRLPGVSVERDQGEGRFVSVRGLGPDLNSVTINGTLVPAPESERRAVALDVLPSELVQSLSVIKTLTPDMDANSLGGTVDVKSLSAFDHKGLFYTGSSEASYDKNTSQTSPKFSGAISDRFSLGDGIDNFGVAAALSWQKRDFGSDNVETGGAWDFEQGSRLEEFEQRDYDIRRERAGGGLNFDYKPDDFSSYYLRTLYSRYKDSETRNAASIAFEDPQAAGELGDAEGKRKLKQREETQEIQSYVLGGERMFGLWTLSGQGGYSQSSEDSPGHIAGATFEGIDGFNGGFYDSDKPRPIIGSGFYDPANFSLDKVDWEEQKTTDTEKNLRLDLARDYDLRGYASQVKFGGKVSRRNKDNDLNAWVYKDFDDLGFTDEQLNLGQFQKGNVDYRLGRFGPGISADAIKQLLGGLNRDEFFDEQESRVNDFKMSEDINAGYLMNTVDIDDWRFIAGMRYEGTEFEAKGTGATDGVFTDTETRRKYHHWLPGLHARYQLDKNTQVRAAWTKSVVRPTFGQLAPGFVIDDDEATFGNPELKPLESSNLDLGIEHFMGHAGTVSAFVFYKDIKNFVYNTDLAGTGAWTDFSEAHSYANGDSAKLYGLELAYSQKFDWLPAPWNGLLLGANTTFSRSDAEIEGFDQASGTQRKRSIDLPNQSDTVGNLMLGWENDKLSLRLSANYKSAYLFELASISDRDHDLHVDAQTFVDFSARYSLTKNLQVSLEAQNLTDEPYFVYTGHRSYNGQYEEYGPTYKLGLTFTHF